VENFRQKPNKSKNQMELFQKEIMSNNVSSAQVESCKGPNVFPKSMVVSDPVLSPTAQKKDEGARVRIHKSRV
jgi:hypothetical protein